MEDAKPAASLSPTLLARKGGARPAMRPQWQPLVNYSTEVPLPPEGLHEHLEDLGWNDMGDAPEAHADSTVVPFGPGDGPMDLAFSNGPPPIVLQQEGLAGHVEHAEPSPLIPLAKHRFARAAAAEAKSQQEARSLERRSALADGRRAAFTLRVDEARHLKLRLACTVQGRSAQQLVTEALDRLLDQLPELDDLAKRVKRR